MKLLILNEGFDKSNMYVNESDFDVVLNISDALYEYENISFKYNNLIELIQALESYKINCDEITLLSGILSFSSEINIRVLFSGFSNLVNRTFVYIDSEQVFYNKSAVVNRCLLALGSNPSVEIKSSQVKMVFNNAILDWSDFNKKATFKRVEKSNVSQDDFIEKVKCALEKKEPFSFIRLNHCENRLIGQGVTFDKSEADITYNRQFGYVIGRNDTNYISNRIKSSVSNADVIGVPLSKKNSTNKLHLLENSTFTHLSLFSLINTQSFVNVNTHYSLGESLIFEETLKNCDDIVAITCRDITNLERHLGKSIEKLEIPAQSHFTEDNGLMERHFPDTFFRLEHKIKEVVKPGTLVLIGAGILGKIYCDLVKLSGGVAIDVGSLMDAIGNVESRGGGFSRFNFWWDNK